MMRSSSFKLNDAIKEDPSLCLGLFLLIQLLSFTGQPGERPWGASRDLRHMEQPAQEPDNHSAYKQDNNLQDYLEVNMHPLSLALQPPWEVDFQSEPGFHPSN